MRWHGDAPRHAPLDSCLRRNDATGEGDAGAVGGRGPFDRLRANGRGGPRRHGDRWCSGAPTTGSGGCDGGRRRPTPRPSGFPRFTNEVQHQSKVLAWSTSSCLDMSGFGLPTYKPQCSGKSGRALRRWLRSERICGGATPYGGEWGCDGAGTETRPCGIAYWHSRRWSPQQIDGAVGPGRGSPGALPREHLPVRLPAASAGQGLPVVSLPPPGQDQTGLAGRGRSSPARFIAHRIPIHQDRCGGYDTFGHWEGTNGFGAWEARLPPPGGEWGSRDGGRRRPAPRPSGFLPAGMTRPEGPLESRRHPFPLAEGRRGERHRPPAPPTGGSLSEAAFTAEPCSCTTIRPGSAFGYRSRDPDDQVRTA